MLWSWQRAWRNAALSVLLIGLDGYGLEGVGAKSWTPRRKLDAREKTRELWNHGYNNYMTFAFPLDELRPLSCTGRGPDWENPRNFANNDVAGNFSLTLIDVLDTFVVLNDTAGFASAVRTVIDWVSFDVNTKPQVFEVTIRALGGLLSGHIFAAKAGGQFYLPWYKDELLSLAYDLGQRLLPAFVTPTGLPYARTNLRYGVPLGESIETCTAGAGSLILEFATLSRLTGDDRFENAALKAFFALWNRRSDIGLVGNTINTFTGAWLNPEVASIGAGIDSFYEYALKWYILSGDVEFLDVWHEAYAAVMRYSRGADGFWFRRVNIHTGEVAFNTLDSLSAFWPGLQVLAGDVENAIKSHQIYWNIWKRSSGLPEVWDIHFQKGTSLQYPLRPEFIESTYYLYRATQDPFYLDVGERVLYDLILRAKVDCGLTGILDLSDNTRDDRMESFVLSETLKYLYLLFDESNPLRKDDSNFVFTTEGHILTLDKSLLRPLSQVRRKMRRVENLQCPVYVPPLIGAVTMGGMSAAAGGVDGTDEENDDGSGNGDEGGKEMGLGSGLVGGVRARADLEYARAVVGVAIAENDKQWYAPEGYCEVPPREVYSYDFVLSIDGSPVPEEFTPGPSKLQEVEDGFVMHNVTGIRAHMVQRLDGKGYDIVKLGPHTVLRGQTVYVNDSRLSATHQDSESEEHGDASSSPNARAKEVQLRLHLTNHDPTLQVQPGMTESGKQEAEIVVPAYTATFGGDITKSASSSASGSGPGSAPPPPPPGESEDVLGDALGEWPGEHEPLRFGHGAGRGSRLARIVANPSGCDEYATDAVAPDSVLVMRRGGCTFLEKLVHAARAGAAGILVISHDDVPINPSADKVDVDAAVQVLRDRASGVRLDEVGAVLVTHSMGEVVLRLLDAVEKLGEGWAEVLVAVVPEERVDVTPSDHTEGSKKAQRSSRTRKKDKFKDGRPHLYINGNPLVNTVLVV